MSIKIVDLDNCISNDGWRMSMIKWHIDDLVERYDKYHSYAISDEFANVDLVQCEDDIVIFTSRPEKFRQDTARWLMRNNIKPLALYMRLNDDFRCSVEIKKSMLKQMMYTDLYISNEDIICAYDDRQDIVNMYKSFGINAEIRMINDYTAYNAKIKGAIYGSK